MSGLPTAPDRDVGLQPPPGEKARRLNPVIILLIEGLNKIAPDGLEEAVKLARTKIPDFMDKLKIKDEDSFITFINDLLKWIPCEDFKGKDIYDILCMFYFIFDQPPLKDLQTKIHPCETGKDLTWLSSWIVVYAQLIGLHMDTPSSLTPDSLKTFQHSDPYRYGEAAVPEMGFRTFNEFFSRRLKPGMRPIDSPYDDRVIVYPADCTYSNKDSQSVFDVQDQGIVNIKGLDWTIQGLLHGSEYSDDFDGGVWMHAFLNTYNYHRQHAPVAGKVLEAINIQGAAYLDVSTTGEPIRKIVPPKQQDPEAEDDAGYQFLQTRGLVVIDNPTLGKVAVLPIGMAQVSSVKLSVQEGDYLVKGDEISTFLFGGSDIVCVFQKRAGLTKESFKESPVPHYSNYGTFLARASPRQPREENGGATPLELSN